jgi:hypothetical protein
MKKAIWLYIIIAILSLGIIYLLTRKEATVTTTTSAPKVDTVRDTDYIPDPILISHTFKGKITQKVSNSPNDTVPYLSGKDTLVVPITQKVYSGADYKAYASGYNIKLDSLQLYPKSTTTTIVKTVTVEKNRSRWNLGVSAGYGISKTGLSPYIGIGINYRLW